MLLCLRGPTDGQNRIALSEAPTDRYALDAQKYNTLYDDIKAEFQKRYINDEGQPAVSTQTSYLLALQLNLLPEKSVRKAIGILR